ncbi:MAG: hypothetical protein IPK99_06110 [Flavobacteriales bacterium]|nr:hypothetical protein [Flavobacteriales bacterium]
MELPHHEPLEDAIAIATEHVGEPFLHLGAEAGFVGNRILAINAIEQILA